jgi:hypothetical protein
MAIDIDSVQSKIAGVIDQDQDVTAISTDDYALRLNYINRREQMWSEVAKWQALYTEYHTLTSTSTGNASLALPADFRTLSGFPEITYDGTNTKQFPLVKGQDEGQMNKTANRYVKILGNPADGYTMWVNSTNSGNHLVSGASIMVPYFKTPASLASPTNKVTCPNPDYLIQGTIADIWEALGDERYQQAKADANIILQNMLEAEFTPTVASYDDSVRTVEQTRYGFRWGA